MRLPHRAPRRLAIPAGPFTGLALLLLTAVSVAAMSSVPRGVGLRFAAAVRGAAPPTDTKEPLIVAVEGNGGVRFEGTAVAIDRLATAVRERVAREPETRVLLVVAPGATYQAAIDAVAPLLRDGVLNGQSLSIPNRRQIEALRGNPAIAGKLP